MKQAGYYLETQSPVEQADHYQLSYIFNRFDRLNRKIYRVQLGAGVEQAPTITSVYGVANWLEREAYDMFGIRFDGHPNLKRLLLPEAANFFPLRKSFKFTGDSLDDLKREEEVQKELYEKEQPQAVATQTKDYFINMGPQHPSTHGVLRLLLHMDGERILDCEPIIGYAHRADEKIAMINNWQQFYPYPARVDYLGGLLYNWGYVGTVEKALGLEVPERAQYIRIIVCELNRIASHLIWLGTLLLDLGTFTPFLYGMDDREKILDLLEYVTGERLTFSYFRFGGLARDVDDEFLKETNRWVKQFGKKLKDYHRLLTQNVIFKNRTVGIGVLSQEQALDFGVTGPSLRATGIPHDLRKQEPYGLYPQFEFDIPETANGDAYDRYLIRMEEMRQSLRLIEQAVNKFPTGGDYLSPKAPKRGVKVPQGETYFCVEGARGEFGCYAVSDGGEIPQRLKLRTACFSNMSAFQTMVAKKNYQISDIVSVLGSLDIVVPDIDR